MPEQQGLTIAPPGKVSPQGISLKARDLTSTDLANILSEHFPGEVTFVPLNPAETFNIDIGNMPPGELILVLAEFGAVATSSSDTSSAVASSIRRSIPQAEVSLKMENTTARDIVVILSQLLGQAPIQLETSNPGEPLSIDASHMDLASLIQGLQATSSIRAVIKP